MKSLKRDCASQHGVGPLNRRAFLTGVAGLAGAGAISAFALTQRPPPAQIQQTRRPPRCVLSAASDGSGNHYLVALDQAGRAFLEAPISSRCHGFAVDPARSGRALAFSRRPGCEAFVINIQERSVQTAFVAKKGRHLYGHGCYSPGGEWIFTSENDFHTGLGVIGVRDARTFALVDEWSTHGIGPHEIQLHPTDGTLVVANGGIRTHPDQPRRKLNLESMAPSIVVLDTKTGALVTKRVLEDPRLGIRHMDIMSDGMLVLGLQSEGDPQASTPLVVLAKTAVDPLQPLEVDGFDWRRMNRYVGSVTAAPHSNTIAISSPRSGRVEIFDLAGRHHIAEALLRDVCGLAYDTDLSAFIATTGQGWVHRLRPEGMTNVLRTRLHQHRLAFDNHAVHLI